MSKHTPVPWEIGRVSSGKGPYDDGGDYPIYYLDESGEMQIIAEVIRRTDTTTYQPAKANAKLIVAAPDLLAALEWVLDAVKWSGWSIQDERWQGPMREARAAIAKATQ